MRLFRKMLRTYIPDPTEVTVLPSPIGTAPSSTRRDDKIKSAVARMGGRWVLAGTRQDYVRQLQAEGWDLV